MIQILHNGKVYTQVKERTHVSALAILDGRVIACGSDDEVLSQFKHHAVITNLEQRTILPGLTDAHIHLSLYALNLLRVDCETNTMQECLDRVQEKGNLISPGKWLLGHGWNQNIWDNRFGNKELLDAIDNLASNIPHCQVTACWMGKLQGSANCRNIISHSRS